MAFFNSNFESYSRLFQRIFLFCRGIFRIKPVFTEEIKLICKPLGINQIQILRNIRTRTNPNLPRTYSGVSPKFPRSLYEVGWKEYRRSFEEKWKREPRDIFRIDRLSSLWMIYLHKKTASTPFEKLEGDLSWDSGHS